MSILGLMENTADIAQTTPTLSAPPSTVSERFGAAWDAVQAPDRYWNAQGEMSKRARTIIDDLHALTGERLKNPYDSTPTQDEIRENLGQPTTVIYAKRLAALREKAGKARQAFGEGGYGGIDSKFLNVDSIEQDIGSESRALREHDESLTGTGGGIGAFAGSMLGETASPHGVLSSFIPVTRMGTAAAEATLIAFSRNVGKEALFQGVTQAGAQTVGTLIDYETRKQFGSEQTTAQIFEEIGSAFAGGTILGGSFRAVHLGILKLASRGVEIPPAVLDAARVMEEGDLYGNKNPLRVSPAQNEVATDQAMGAAVMGRAASPDVDVNPTQTLHEAARRLEPELMRRYDAAIAARNEVRELLAPTDETIARLKERADAADAAIAGAGPQTREGAERLGQQARTTRLIYEDALERKAAQPPAPAAAEGLGTPAQIKEVEDAIENIRRINDKNSAADIVELEGKLARLKGETTPPTIPATPGAAALVPETTVSRSLRQQGEAADAELRDLIPEINKLMRQAGEEVTAAQRAADAARAQAEPKAFTPEAGTSEARLSPEEVSRVREIQEQIPDYERLRDAATTPEDKAAWQQAIDDFNTEIAKIMDLDIADQAPVKAAMNKIEAVPTNPMQEPRITVEPKERPAVVKPPGESAEDKAVLQQATQLLDNDELAKVVPGAKQEMDRIDMQEREYKQAASCVIGVL